MEQKSLSNALGQEVLILNPEYKIRMDKDNRVILAHVLPYEFQKGWVIHPGVGFILSLFDGNHTETEVWEIVRYVGGLTDNQLQGLIKKLRTWQHRIPQLLIPISQVPMSRRYRKTRIDYEELKRFLILPSQVKLDEPHRFYSPLVIVLLPTYRCFADCIYCYAERRKIHSELPLGRIKEIIDEAAELKVFHFSLSGGDPFMRADILEILRHMVYRGFDTTPSTKKPLSWQMVNNLADIGISSVQVSLDTCDPLLADVMTRSREYLKHATQTIRRLLKVGIDARVNAVITSFNIRYIDELCKYLLDLGVTAINLSRYSRSAYRHSDLLFVNDEDIKILQEKVEQIRHRYPDAHITMNYELTKSYYEGRERARWRL